MANPIEDEELDPVVRAAMIPDPDEKKGEEDKKTDDANLDSTNPKKADDLEKESEDKKPEDGNQSKDETKTNKGDEQVKKDPDKEVPKTDPEKSEERQTRKERREERKQRFIEKIRRDTVKPTIEEKPAEPEKKPEPYKPLDFEEGQYDSKELEEDRSKYADQKAKEAAEAASRQERFKATQEKFWGDLEHESKLLSVDPKYSFLDENSANFDEDLAADVNELYLELVGFDQKTKTVNRVDISYDKFVRNHIQRMEDFAEARQAETTTALAAQQASSGIRPTGSSASKLKQLKPGDITKMSQEDFEKHEAEIDAQIMEMLS